MSQLSMTGSGIVVYILTYLLKHYGFDLDDGIVTEFVTNAAQIISVIATLYGQFRRKDLVGGIIRKG